MRENNSKIKNNIILGIILILGLCACFAYYQETKKPKTELVIVEEYKVDDTVGEGIEEPVEEMLSSTEMEVPIETSDDGNGNMLKTSMSEVNLYKTDEKSLKLDTKIHYYYSVLNKEQKAIYRNILGAYRNMEYSFQVDVPYTDFSNYNRMVMNDHPELFWVDSSYTYYNYGYYVKVIPSYNRDQDQVKAAQKKLFKERDKILKNAPKKASAYEKTKYVFKTLIDKTDYVAGSPDNQNIYSCLVNHKTVCAGYTRATQYLLQKLGVKCLYVSGDTERGRHAWNIVKCGDHYYQVDTTWGDPNYSIGSDGKKIPDVLQYSYEYLCTDDKTMLKERKQDALPGAPKCEDDSKKFYPMNKRYYTKYGEAVKKSIKKNLKDGKNYWHCQFSNKDSFNAMLKACKDGLYGKLMQEVKGTWKSNRYWYFPDSYVIKLYY